MMIRHETHDDFQAIYRLFQAAFATTPHADGDEQDFIERALALNPPLVLADEPTGNLNTVSAEGLFELMRMPNADHGTTFLLVTHSPDLASRCDRTITAVDGQIKG